DAPHVALPPETGPTVEFGRHLSGVCTGCHQADLAGGRTPGQPPDWLPGANLTPHADGLAGWTFEDFQAVMKTGKKKDGTAVGVPMSMVLPYTAAMTEVEQRALW